MKTKKVFFLTLFLFLFSFSVALALGPGEFGCNSDGDCEPNPGGSATCCLPGSHMCASTGGGGGGPYCYGEGGYYAEGYYYGEGYYYSQGYYYAQGYYYDQGFYYNQGFYYSEGFYYQTPEYEVEVVTRPVGGYVKSSDNLINCKSDCEDEYAEGETVRLRAYPNSSYWKFSGWGAGDCASFGSNPLCTLNINSNKSVRANFIPRTFQYREL